MAQTRPHCMCALPPLLGDKRTARTYKILPASISVCRTGRGSVKARAARARRCRLTAGLDRRRAGPAIACRAVMDAL